MGFTLIVHSPPRYARFECPEGDATFSLHTVDASVSGAGVVVYFECADLDARVERLLASGLEFTQLPTDERWLWREARLNDPSGNVICLFRAGPNRKNPPWRVGPVDSSTTETPRAIDKGNAEHYAWGEVSEGWRLLEQPDLSVMHERVPPGAGEVRHYHSKARQFFFVLYGSATLEFGTGPVTFHSGQGVHVPPGTPHRFANLSDSPVEFLVVSSPSTAGDRTNVEAGT